MTSAGCEHGRQGDGAGRGGGGGVGWGNGQVHAKECLTHPYQLWWLEKFTVSMKRKTRIVDWSRQKG